MINVFAFFFIVLVLLLDDLVGDGQNRFGLLGEIQVFGVDCLSFFLGGGFLGHLLHLVRVAGLQFDLKRNFILVILHL